MAVPAAGSNTTQTIAESLTLEALLELWLDTCRNAAAHVPAFLLWWWQTGLSLLRLFFRLNPRDPGTWVAIVVPLVTLWILGRAVRFIVRLPRVQALLQHRVVRWLLWPNRVAQQFLEGFWAAVTAPAPQAEPVTPRMDRLAPPAPAASPLAYQAVTPAQTPIIRRRDWLELAPVAAQAAVIDYPAAQTYAGLELVARRLWQGGHQPQFHGAGNDRDTRAQEQLIDEYWASKLGKGKKLSEITPNPGSAEVPVPTVLTLLNTLEAMREAIMLYASYVPSLTLGQMQYLLHNLLRRQAGTKWTELLELCQEQLAIAWPEVTKRACAKLNVQTREEWEQVLTAFTRTSGQRELVLSEFAFRFRILAQASVFGTSPSDDSFLYEMLLRVAQVPGLVYWAQAKARSRGPAVVHDAYATVAQGFGYLTEWGKLSQDERDEAINKEATLSDKALTHLFKCLRGHAQPNISFLWAKDLREQAYLALENGLRSSVRQRIEAAPSFLNTFSAAPTTSQAGADKKKKSGESKSGDRKNGREPTALPQPLVAGALQSNGTVPTLEELRAHSDCWNCGRPFRECRSGKGQKRFEGRCQHADAKAMRPTLFAYARYPRIFVLKKANGTRDWPKLNEKEKQAVKAFSQRVGGDCAAYGTATFINLDEEGQEDTKTATDIWADELLNFVSTDGEAQRYPAWIDGCRAKGLEVAPLVDTGGGSNFVTASLASKLGLEQADYNGAASLGASTPLRVHGTVTVPL